MCSARAGDSSLADRLGEEISRLRAGRSALQALGAEARISLLTRVAERWCDPGDRFRQEALRLLPQECLLSEQQVVWGLEQAFSGVTAPALGAWWAREGGPTSMALSAHLWSGNVFVAGLPPLFASLLAGVPALIKAPALQPSFAALLVASMAEHAPALGASVGQAAWSRADTAATDALLGAPQVVFAFGADETMATLQTRLSSQTRFCGFGHRYSIAVVLPEAAELLASGSELTSRSGSLAGLLRDHLVWDGQGCLTPRWIFVEGGMEQAEAIARRAAEALPDVATRFPGQRLAAGPGAARSSWLAAAAFAGWSEGGDGWAVAAVPWSGSLPEPGPPRCLSFAAVPDLLCLPQLLAPLGHRLQGLARLGEASRDQELSELCAPLGLSRLAQAGALQQPPVDWNHDDVRILASLCTG